jgi:hypothetical protein
VATDDDAVDAGYNRVVAAHDYWRTLPADERQACHIAGLALYLYGELPAVEDKDGYCTEQVAREAVSAAHYILPGQCNLTPPEDREEFAARVRIVRALVNNASVTQHAATEALLNIAADALDVLAALLGRSEREAALAATTDGRDDGR